MANDLDYLNMSDEDWLNASPAQPTSEEDPPAAEPETVTDGEATAEPEGADDGEVAQETQETPAEEPEASDEEKPEGTEEVAEEATDYKAVYEKLTRPFKANGRDIQIKDVDDAIALMQMGANYNKKMAALRPHLKLMKLLETNGLMDEEKIGYLIDLQGKNPAAISRLLKDSGVDPMDLDESKAEDYKPTVRTVDDREIELDQVLEDIQDSPSYSKTLQVVSKQWDASSKQVVANSPQLLKVINSHIESGIYDTISEELEKERMFGRLTGLSDIEAYRQIGDSIQARGGFNHIRPNVNTAPATRTAPIPPKPSQEQVQKVKDRKRAASTTNAAPTPVAKEFNPLALSDEEFSKLIKPGYI